MRFEYCCEKMMDVIEWGEVEIKDMKLMWGDDEMCFCPFCGERTQIVVKTHKVDSDDYMVATDTHGRVEKCTGHTY